MAYAVSRMKDLLLTLLHLTVMTATQCGPGGVRAVIAENLLLKQQLIVLRRPRQRAPRLTASDRLLFGFGALFLSRERIRKVAIGVRPSTLLALHQALVRRKYRRLFSSSQCPKKPGPKGPSEALIQAIVELKSRNPRFGCPRIARIIARTFGVNIDKNVVYRVLSRHYCPTPGRQIAGGQAVPMRLYEGLPRRSSGPLGSRFDPVVVQHPLDRVPGDVVAEIRERATDARVAPRWILDRHPHHEVSHLAWRDRPASTSVGAAVVLPGNQPPVPAENRVGCDDAGDLRQNPPAEFLASHRESTALGVGQAKWTWATLLPEDPILLPKIIDHVWVANC